MRTNADGTPRASSQVEIRRWQRSATRYRLLAFRDDVTGAKNGRSFEAEFGARVRHLKRGGPSFGVGFADLNAFGRFNKRYGQAVGNAALREFVEATTRRLRPSDAVFRLHGDEFAFLIDVRGRPALDAVLERLSEPVLIAVPRRCRSEHLSATVVGLIARSRDVDRLLPGLDRQLRMRKHLTVAGRSRLLSKDPAGRAPTADGSVTKRMRDWGDTERYETVASAADSARVLIVPRREGSNDAL